MSAETIACPKCGQPVLSECKFCPYCGCELEPKPDCQLDNQAEKQSLDSREATLAEESEAASQTNQEEFTPAVGEEAASEAESATEALTAEEAKPAKSFNKKLWIPVICVVGLALIAACIFAVHSSNVKKAQEAKDEYIANLNLFSYSALNGAADAENLCNLTVKVWSNAIWDKSDPETSQYTLGTEDFNEALTNLFDASETKEKVTSIQTYQRLAKEAWTELQEAPEGFERQLETANELYDAFLAFTNLAIGPTGSLLTYRQDAHDKDSAFLERYNKLDSQVSLLKTED